MIETTNLWRRYASEGDRRDREQLMSAYAPLVERVVAKLAGGLPAHVDEAELLSYGLEGLAEALERFDSGREIKFETFATARIRGAIIDELRAQDWAPRTVRDRAKQIERVGTKLESSLQRSPSERELAAVLELSHDELRNRLLQSSRATLIRLDGPRGERDGEPITLIDMFCDDTASNPERELEHSELRRTITDAIVSLPTRETILMSLYYYHDLTLREIGNVLGVTESRVCQLHAKAVRTLRHRLQGFISVS
jgi:RNA polymerase sigma factor for flagellar operon FliA